MYLALRVVLTVFILFNHRVATIDDYVETIGCMETKKEWFDSHRASREKRKKTRARVKATCRAMGGTPSACEVIDIITVRESSGDPCAIHVLGENEYGLGPHGLSWDLHQGKWFAPDDKDRDKRVFHVPEISTIVAMRILRRAQSRYGADEWWKAGAVYAGRMRKEFWGEARFGDNVAFCRRLERHGIDCEEKIGDQLGKKLGNKPNKEQEAFVLDLIAKADD